MEGLDLKVSEDLFVVRNRKPPTEGAVFTPVEKGDALILDPRFWRVNTLGRNLLYIAYGESVCLLWHISHSIC